MLRATNRASFAAACLSLLLGPGLPAESAEVEVGRQDCLRLIRHAAGDHSASDHAAGDDLAADSLRKGGSADRTVGATDFGDAGAGGTQGHGG